MTNWDPRLLLSSSSSSSSHRFFPWPLPRFFMTTCTTPSIGRAIDPSSSSSLQLRSDGCCCNPPSSVLGMGCCDSRHYGGCNQSNRRSFTTTIIDDSQQKSRDVTEAKESSIQGLATGSTSVPIPNNEGQEEENDKKKNSASSAGDVGKLFSPNALLPMSLLQLELKYSDGKAPQVVMIPSGVPVAYAMGLLRKLEGFLQDTHGLLLADEEVLTSEGAPYVFNVVSPQGRSRAGGGGQTHPSHTANLKRTHASLAAERTSSVVFARTPWHTQCHLRWQLGPFRYLHLSLPTCRSTRDKVTPWQVDTTSSWHPMPQTVADLMHSWKTGSSP